MTLARLYGRLLGHGSLAVVTEGFRSALSDAGLLAGCFGLDVSDDDDAEPADGADARHAVYTGPLNLVGKMFERGQHQIHWVMIAPNSRQLPQDLVAQLKKFQEKYDVRFLAPSAWAAGVVREFLGECMSVPHGVSKEFRVIPELAKETAELYRAGEFRVLHFSTSDRQRKGTIELLRAWRHWKCWEGLASVTTHRGARLSCVMDYPAKVALEEAIADGAVEWDEVKDSVSLIDRLDLGAARMAQVLGRAHLVCQPSRGEAFGLVPLQALACGVPIMATRVTGHTEYLQPGSVPGAAIVATGKEVPLDDLPGSTAPVVDWGGLLGTLIWSRSHWRENFASAQSNAESWQRNWSWGHVLGPFLSKLEAT